MENIEQHVEALIFASEQSIRTEEILYCLQAAFQEDFNDGDVNAAIESIKQKYASSALAIELVKTGSGYQFLTKKAYHGIINQFQIQQSKKKLSQAAMETLAIVAYKQPVTKLDIEQIRGVNSDYSLQKLLEKELIIISGKSDAVGRPLLYSTSQLFMDYFGINSITELPQVKELANDAVSIGEQQE